MKLLSLLLTCLFISSTASPEAPKPFEGSVIYTIEYVEVPDEVKGMESMLPQETTMKMKGNLVRVEQNVMGGSQIVLVDTDTDETHVLMDMMGQKIDIFISAEEAKEGKEEALDPIVEEMEGRKQIAGYSCKQAKITDPNTGNVQEVYYTKDLEGRHNAFQQLEGFPLEYYSVQQGMTLRMTAKSVVQEALPESVFDVPEGYTQMTSDELSKLMGN